MLLNELNVTPSQMRAVSQRHAQRLLGIYRDGNDDKHNPQKALRDLTQSKEDEKGKPKKPPILGPGGPHTNQPTPSQAKAMLVAAGINPDREDAQKQINQSGMPEVSPNQDAKRKRDYIPSRWNAFNPPRRYGDGQRKVMGQLWSKEIAPIIRAYQRALRQGNARAMRKIAGFLYRKHGMRIGGRPVRRESNESKFLNTLDEALGL